MRKQPFLSLRQLGRGLLAGSVALLFFGGRRAGAQAAPAAKPAWAWVQPGTLFYLDGKPSTLAEVQRVKDDAISSGEGVALLGKDSGDQTFGGLLAPAAEIITTKANANSPAVLALADQLDLRAGYAEKPAPISAIAPPALAYITSHYPQAWLAGQVTELTQKSTGAVRYRVLLADRWSIFPVDFTSAGALVAHPLASPVAKLLVLTLGYPHAPAADQPSGPALTRQYAPLYLNGQRTSLAALRALSPDSLASVVALPADLSQLLAPAAAGLGLLSVVTKQGQNQLATLAFTQRVHEIEIIQRLAAHSRRDPAAAAEAAALKPPASGEPDVIRYYLDSKPVALAAVEKLNRDTVASVDVADEARAGRAVLIKTKQLPPLAERGRGN